MQAAEQIGAAIAVGLPKERHPGPWPPYAATNASAWSSLVSNCQRMWNTWPSVRRYVRSSQ